MFGGRDQLTHDLFILLPPPNLELVRTMQLEMLENLPERLRQQADTI